MVVGGFSVGLGVKRLGLGWGCADRGCNWGYVGFIGFFYCYSVGVVIVVPYWLLFSSKLGFCSSLGIAIYSYIACNYLFSPYSC